MQYQTKLGKFIILAILAGTFATYALVGEAVEVFTQHQTALIELSNQL